MYGSTLMMFFRSCSWFIQQLVRLRQDLVNVKALTRLSLEREGTKFRQTEIVHDILVAALLPLYASMRSAFEWITRQVFFIVLLLLNAWWILVLTRRITSKILYRSTTYPITSTSSRILCAGLWLMPRSMNLNIGIFKRSEYDIYVFCSLTCLLTLHCHSMTLNLLSRPFIQ